MKYLHKAAIAALASASMFAVVSAASAQTVSPTGPITVSGQLNQSLAGGQFLTVCDVTFQGVADANGFTLNSYTGTNVNGGDLACDDSLVFPIRVNTVPNQPSQLRIQTMTVSTRLGSCTGSNIPLSWSNATSGVTFPVGTIIAPVCEFNGTLTVSPATTIN